MQLRSLLTLVNFSAIAVAIVVLFEHPSWANDAFYLLLGWMVGSLALIYSPWATRPIGGRASAPPAAPGTPGSTPLAAGSHASSIGFCLYCATPVEPGTARCPTCGRLLPNFS